MNLFRDLALTFMGLYASAGSLISAAEPAVVTLQRPMAHQVVQREGFVPENAHANKEGGPELGFAHVPIVGTFPRAAKTFEYRALLTEGAMGRDVDWTTLAGQWDGDAYHAHARVPAGGWYRLEVRAKSVEDVVATATVEPVGVGELFVVAGQSYATNANDERLKVTDPLGRVVAFDASQGQWRIAHDPQPADGSDGGSIWPAFGDALLPGARVPIGLVNVAVGGTASEQWLPGGELFERLSPVASQVGQFRAVLWQQGESDVIGAVSTERYVANLTQIRDAAAKQWGFDPPWLLAKSTLHPTVYDKPAEEAAIRKAIDQLCRLPGFRPGPDTDILGGTHRGGPKTRRHFSGEGQRAAGLLWFVAVWQELNATHAFEATPAK